MNITGDPLIAGPTPNRLSYPVSYMSPQQIFSTQTADIWELCLWFWVSWWSFHEYFDFPYKTTGLSQFTIKEGSPSRILKMPVQNSNSKISARPDLATQLLQILIPTTFDNLLCQKGQFTLPPCPRGCFVWLLSKKKSTLKILHRHFYLSKVEVFRKLPVQKRGWTGPG